MKNFITIVFLMFVGIVSLSAQPDNVRSLIQKFSSEDAFTMLNLSDASPLLNDFEGDNVAKEALKGVKSLKILSFDPKKNKNLNRGKDFSRELRSLTPAGLNDIMTINNDGRYIKMFGKNDPKGADEFILLVASDDKESLIMYLTGEFDYNRLVAKMRKKFDKK